MAFRQNVTKSTADMIAATYGALLRVSPASNGEIQNAVPEVKDVGRFLSHASAWGMCHFLKHDRLWYADQTVGWEEEIRKRTVKDRKTTEKSAIEKERRRVADLIVSELRNASEISHSQLEASYGDITNHCINRLLKSGRLVKTIKLGQPQYSLPQPQVPIDTITTEMVIEGKKLSHAASLERALCLL